MSRGPVSNSRISGSLPSPERCTGSYSYNSAHSPQRMPADKAATLYAKLKPFLRVVKSWGMYLPLKPGQRDHSMNDWPLAYRPGLEQRQIQWPVPVMWGPRRQGRAPTFAEFLEAYRITVEL